MIEIQKRTVLAWLCIETVKSLKSRFFILLHGTEDRIDISVVDQLMDYSNKDQKMRFFNTLKATATTYWLELGDKRTLIITEDAIFIEK